MIVVTGGAGFIGSNIVHAMNKTGERDIIVVDDLTDGKKIFNLTDLDIADYLDKDDFLARIMQDKKFARSVRVIFHEGACSTTTNWNGRFMMQNNYEYSKALLHASIQQRIQFIYASSAAVYGAGKVFKESAAYEAPINAYAYSKWQFDQYVRRLLPEVKTQVVGLRYFNVYGPREQHKENMASVVWHHYQQLLVGDTTKLFKGCDGYGDGEQRRDFICVEDAVDVNLWMMAHPEIHGIFNVGTGRSQTFNDVAQAVIAWHRRGQVEYIPFPEHLKGHYQSFTEADVSALRDMGYEKSFKTVDQGVKDYMDIIAKRTQ